MAEPIRISMWSGPRNISTTMMRSFENRSDTVAVDEPFYAYYLTQSGAEHPMRDEILAAQPHDWRDVVKSFDAPHPDDASILFQKHIAYHLGADVPLDWLERHRAFLLIRDPHAMVASYRHKFPDVAPIADSFLVQRRIYDHLAAKEMPCPVITAKDVLLNPEGMLRALCNALDIFFMDEMMSWPSGARESDGVWGPHWYDAVMTSTGFRTYEKKDVTLPPELMKVVETCRPHYDFFHERRLTAAA